MQIRSTIESYSSKKCAFNSFFKSCNGLGISSYMFDTIPSVRSFAQTASFFCFFIFLLLYFDKADLSVNLFRKPSERNILTV